MARNRKPTPTKTVIVKIASELFFENGFTKTTSTEICKKADISPGNLTFYFPNKESILATLVQMMIDFQWKEMEAQTDEGKSSLLAYCLELTTLVALSEEIPQMQDFLLPLIHILQHSTSFVSMTPKKSSKYLRNIPWAGMTRNLPKPKRSYQVLNTQL